MNSSWRLKEGNYNYFVIHMLQWCYVRVQPLTIKIDINHGDRVERVVKIMLDGDFHTKYY